MNMDKNIENRDNENLLQHREEFETVYGIISAHKKRAMNAMHNESLNMLWEVGAIAQSIRWYSFMKPIHHRGSTRLFTIMVCNTTCQILISENFLMRRKQLCHLKWHK